MKEIADRIRQARLDAGLTQQQLANKIGIRSRSFICDMEHDKFDPGIEVVKKIAVALDVDPGYLIFGDLEHDRVMNKIEEVTRLFDQLSFEDQKKVLVEIVAKYGDRVKDR